MSEETQRQVNHTVSYNSIGYVQEWGLSLYYTLGGCGHPNWHRVACTQASTRSPLRPEVLPALLFSKSTYTTLCFCMITRHFVIRLHCLLQVKDHALDNKQTPPTTPPQKNWPLRSVKTHWGYSRGLPQPFTGVPASGMGQHLADHEASLGSIEGCLLFVEYVLIQSNPFYEPDENGTPALILEVQGNSFSFLSSVGC